MFRRVKLLFVNPELRTKLLKVLGLLIFARLLTAIPIPGIALRDLSGLVDNNAIFQLLNVISGGGYGTLSFVMLGVSPYITASIIFQLLGVIIPKINKIQKEEGEQGRAKINRWTRWLTFPLALLSAWGILRYLAQEETGLLPANFFGEGANTTWIVTIFALACGSIVIMWIGEILNELKLGNGISLLILSGIVSQIPKNLYSNWQSFVSGLEVARDKFQLSYLWNWEAYKNFFTDPEWFSLKSVVVLIFSFIVTLLLVVFMNDSIRKLLIIYSRRGHVEGSSRLLKAVKADLPIKVNMAGVMPIIFAVSFILLPTMVATYTGTANIPSIAEGARNVQQFVSTEYRTDPQTGQPPVKPESVRNTEILGVYRLDTQEKLLAAKKYDLTIGQELFGFTVNNFSTKCVSNDDPDASQQEKDYANSIRSQIWGIQFPCGWRIPQLGEWALHFPGFLAYNVFYFFLIIFFTYFYTTNIGFKTDDVAENLQKSGAFIPGVQPGLPTEKYLTYLSHRLNIVGSIFIAFIAMLPLILSRYINFDSSTGLGSIVGGTTILILVSVSIETLRQIDSQLSTVDYERFEKGELKRNR